MQLLTNPAILDRVKHSSTCWMRGDFDNLMKNFREDAVLSSPLAHHEHGAQSSWLQGYREIRAELTLVRCIHPRLKRMDLLYGTNFVVVLMGDGERYLTMQIEPDEEGMVRRLIICLSASLDPSVISYSPLPGHRRRRSSLENSRPRAAAQQTLQV